MAEMEKLKLKVHHADTSTQRNATHGARLGMTVHMAVTMAKSVPTIIQFYVNTQSDTEDAW